MADSEQSTRFRRSNTVLVVTGVAAVGVLLAVIYALTGPPRPRPVSYVGAWGDKPTCHGPSLWAGERAYAACDWFYDKRALVELDPETAEAMVIHRWEVDDGNTPELRIAQSCGDGWLFVIAETKQTTVVTRRGEAVRPRVAEVAGERVLGAACEGDEVELFVARAEGGYASLRSDGEGFAAAARVETSDGGRVVAAWHEDGAWHVVAEREQQISVGELGGDGTVIGTSEGTVCAAGAPGGWLFVGSSAGCSSPDVLVTRVGDAFRLTPSEGRVARVVYQGREPRVGFSSEQDAPLLLTGMGELDLELGVDGEAFVARRSEGPDVAVAKRSYSSLRIGACAFPLSGDRVAIWGGIGESLIIVGPDLARTDGPSAPAQLMSAVHFLSSSTSLFDVICFYTLTAASLLYLGLLGLAWRRRKPPEPLPIAPGLAWAYLLLVALGARGLYHVVVWL
jgi:hypothetical protein